MCSILLTFLNVFGVLGSTLSLGAAHPDALFSLCEFKCNTQRCKHTEQLLQVERICGQLELVGAYDVKGGERSTALWLTQWQSRPRTHTEYSEKQWNCTFWDPAVKASILHSLGKLINRLDFHRQGKEDEVCFQERRIKDKNISTLPCMTLREKTGIPSYCCHTQAHFSCSDAPRPI